MAKFNATEDFCVALIPEKESGNHLRGHRAIPFLGSSKGLTIQGRFLQPYTEHLHQTPDVILFPADLRSQHWWDTGRRAEIPEAGDGG